MKTTPQPPWSERALAGRPLLAGVACAFAACCLLGEHASRRNPFVGFRRFHNLMNPRTLFYPTAAQVRAVARDGLRRDQVLVVIGGNSILWGAGQRREHLWTIELQRLLGGRYKVVNLALPSAGMFEFGGVAADALVRDHPRLIFVIPGGTAGMGTLPDGIVYRYLYWEVYHIQFHPRGSPWHERATALRREHLTDPAFVELDLQLRLDRFTRSRDLWTTAAYKYFSTVWVPALCPSIGPPRRTFDDPEPWPAVPFASRHPPELDALMMSVLRDWIAGYDCMRRLRPPALPPNVCEGFAGPGRRRTLVLFLRDSPYYVRCLRPEEQAAYDESFDFWERQLGRLGVAALDVGWDFSVSDFYDRCHLSESGGARLAAQAAPRIRRMAEELGYLGGR
jgi:hypothetical protein